MQLRNKVGKYSWEIQLKDTVEKFIQEILTECNTGIVEEGAEEGSIFEENENN